MRRSPLILVSITLPVLLLSAISLKAGKLDQAFEALSQYNYFKAKELFQKTYQKYPSASGYGLSYIYVTNNNPFYNLDSARKYILESEAAFATYDSKQKEKIREYQVDSIRIQVLKSKVCRLAFDEAMAVNTIASYNYFIKNYGFSDEKAEAEGLRNQLIFEKVRGINTSTAYADFMNNYPDAEQFNEVKRRYDKAVYLEQTENGQISAYVNFIEAFPENPYVLDAMDMIYALSINHKTLDEYARFIKNHPNNRNVSKAWRVLYALYMKDYSQQRMAEFRLDYPDYPFKNELMKDFSLSFKDFYPVRHMGKWGFADQDGNVMIRPQYDMVSDFKEGLCVVSRAGKSGFMDKSGNLKIPIMYDEAELFRDGYAVVMKEGKYGLINKANLVQLPFVYDDIGEFYDNIAYFEQNGKFGYLNVANEVVVRPVYDGCGDFDQGYAYVEIQGQYGIIDRQGEIVIPIEFDWLETFKDGLARVRKGKKFGLYDIFGTVIADTIYDNIGAYSDSRCLVSIGDKHGYLNRKGEIVIPFDYDFELGALNWGQFHRGYARVKTGDKFAMIDTSGNRILPAVFEDIGVYTDTYIAVKKRGKWGYCDHKARLTIPYRYDYAWEFTADSIAKIRMNGKSGYINLEGNELVYAVFDEISKFTNNRAISTKEGLYGLIDKKNNIIVPFQYKDLKYRNNLLAADNDGLLVYLNPSTGEVVWQENREVQ